MSIHIPRPIPNIACQSLLTNDVKYHGHLRRRRMINKYLEQLGGQFLKWSRNYVVIYNCSVYCYNNEFDEKANKSCSLYGFSGVEEVTVVDGLNGPLWTFKVINGLHGEPENLYFSAATSEDKTKWIKAFEEEILIANKASPASVAPERILSGRPLPKPKECIDIDIYNSDSESSNYEEIEEKVESKDTKTPKDSKVPPKLTTTLPASSSTNPASEQKKAPELKPKPKPKVLPKQNPPQTVKVKPFNDTNAQKSSKVVDEYDLYDIEGLWENERIEEAERKLSEAEKGTFIVRSSRTADSSSKTLVVKQNDFFKKYRIFENETSCSLTANAAEEHKQPNIPALLSFYKNNNLPNADFKLTKALSNN